MAKKSIFKRWWFWIIAIVLVIGAIGSSGGNKKTEQASTGTKQEETKNEVKKEDPNKITYEKFNQISMGMTYEQAKEILGEGKESTSSEVNGIKTVMYSWSNSGGSNMNVTFQGNKALSKTQLGLAKGNAKV